MGEQHHILAGRAGAAQAADDVTGLDPVDRRCRVDRNPPRQGDRAEGGAGLLVQQPGHVAPGAGNHALRSGHRHDGGEPRHAGIVGAQRAAADHVADLIPGNFGADHDDDRGGAGGGYGPDALRDRREAFDLRAVEQDQHDRALHIGAGQLVDAAIRQARAMRGENQGRIGQHFMRAAPGDDDIVRAKLARLRPRPTDRRRLGTAGSEVQGLEPGPVLPGRLEAAGAELLDDVGSGAALPVGAGRAALELVAGEDADVAEQVGGGDRSLRGEWSGAADEKQRGGADEGLEHGAA